VRYGLETAVIHVQLRLQLVTQQWPLFPCTCCLSMGKQVSELSHILMPCEVLAEVEETAEIRTYVYVAL